MEMAGEHARKRKFYDRSAWDYTLENGIHGRCQVSQSTPGHQDDIHFHVKKKDGSQLLWRMPWGTETLWYAPPKSEVSLEKVDGWEPHNRCNTDRFQHEDIDAIFDMMSPPEHIQGWHMFMLYFYADVLGDTYKRTDDPIYEYLPPAFKTHDVAGIDDGVEMTAAVAGLLHVFEGENKTANIPDLIAAAS